MNSGDVGVNSAGESRMASRARQDLWKMKADRKQSKELGDGMEGKSITETVETETKDHQVRNLPGTGESRWTREEGGGS